MPKSSGRAPRLRLRAMTSRDIPDVVALNEASYPTLAEDNVVWGRGHLESHLRVFPQGQILATLGGTIVGAVSSLIVNLGPDPLRDHTWAGITDNGFFTSHDPGGDTLYGADVCVHPDYRGAGIARRLYEARENLCRDLDLRRIVLGGRLYDYGRKARSMSADEYARRVEAGDLNDTVLGFQLALGFTLRKVMPNYLSDRRSRNHAAFLEWINPDHTPKPSAGRKVRVSCVQYRMRKIASFEAFAQQVEYFTDAAADYGADIVLFPELVTAQLMSFLPVKTPMEAIRRLTTLTKKVDAMFKRLARRYDLCIIGGSHPRKDGKRILNVATLYRPDGSMERQAKIHITPNERRWWGIEGGDSIHVFETPKARIGILVCYDSEFPEQARVLVDRGAEILFVPYCTDDRQGHLRVRYCCQARAVENFVYVATAGNVGNLPEAQNMDVQYAQSAVLTPSDFPFGRDGIQVEASANTETIITADLDLELLGTGETGGTVTPRRDRRRDLFRLQYVEGGPTKD